MLKHFSNQSATAAFPYTHTHICISIFVRTLTDSTVVPPTLTLTGITNRLTLTPTPSPTLSLNPLSLNPQNAKLVRTGQWNTPHPVACTSTLRINCLSCIRLCGRWWWTHCFWHRSDLPGKEGDKVKNDQKWHKYRGTMLKTYFTKCHSIAHVVPSTPTNFIRMLYCYCLWVSESFLKLWWYWWQDWLHKLKMCSVQLFIPSDTIWGGRGDTRKIQNRFFIFHSNPHTWLRGNKIITQVSVICR